VWRPSAASILVALVPWLIIGAVVWWLWV